MSNEEPSKYYSPYMQQRRPIVSEPQVGDIWNYLHKTNFLLEIQHYNDTFTALDLTTGKSYRIMLDYYTDNWRLVA